MLRNRVKVLQIHSETLRKKAESRQARIDKLEALRGQIREECQQVAAALVR
jgi:chaperonin cofactor prefoldin